MIEREKWGIETVEAKKKGRTVLIYGEAGRGKTTLLNTLKGRTLIISIDCGEQVLQGDNIDMFYLVDKDIKGPSESIKKFEAFATYLLEQKELPWDFIAFDNISEFQDCYLEALQANRGIKYPRQLEYRDVGIEMRRWLRQLRNLTYKGVNVIYIAWEEVSKITDTGGEVISDKQPMIMGKSCKTVMGLVDFVAAMRVDNKGNRYLQFDGDVKYMAKKREEPGMTYPSFLECPKAATDTLSNFFKLIGDDDAPEQPKSL